MLELVERSAIKLLKKRGMSQRQMAATVGRSRPTVARILQEPSDQTYQRPPRGSVADSFAADMERWIHQGLPVQRMLELARADASQPYTGGKSVFYDRVRALRQQCATQAGDVVLRFEGLPGEYVQIDWGEHKVELVRGGRQKVCFLAVRLKFSRYLYVEFHDNMRSETLLRGLLRACVHLGGVPWHWVFDNMKTVVLGRDGHGQPVLQPTFAKFAAELDFHPDLCAPRSPQQKGTVENLVGFVKSNFFPGRVFVDWEDLWRQGAAWQDRVNHQPCQAHEQCPAMLLKQEQAQFSPLPKGAHDYGLLHLCQVSWSESVFHYQTNRYSVPVEYRGQAVLVRVHEKRLKVYVEDVRRKECVLIADHPRCLERGRRIIDPAHFAAVLERKPRGKVMLYRQQLLDLGEPVSSYIAEVCRKYRTDFGRQILTLYTLWQGRGEEEFKGAVTAAQTVGAYGAEYVTYLLEVPVSERKATAQRWQGLPTQEEVDRPLAGYEAFVLGAAPSPPPRPASVNGGGMTHE